MFIYLVAIVVIICSFFGLTYSQTSLRAIRNEAVSLSTIQLPAFLHGTPVIERPQAGVDGDNGIAGRSSQQSLEIYNDENLEEAIITEWKEDENLPLKDDRYQLEKKIFDHKLRDANQLGLAESLWQPAPQKGSDKVMKDIMNQKYASDGSKPTSQKINTNTIFNMIQYETFKEAMAVLQKQEEEEAAKEAVANEQREKSMENGRQTLQDEKQKENIPVRKNANDSQLNP